MVTSHEPEFFELKNVKRYIYIYFLKRELNYERYTEGMRLVKSLNGKLYRDYIGWCFRKKMHDTWERKLNW